VAYLLWQLKRVFAKTSGKAGNIPSVCLLLKNRSEKKHYRAKKEYDQTLQNEAVKLPQRNTENGLQ